MTELANALSRQGSDLGGDFCPRNSLVFSEVYGALISPSQLADFCRREKSNSGFFGNLFTGFCHPGREAQGKKC